MLAFDMLCCSHMMLPEYCVSRQKMLCAARSASPVFRSSSWLHSSQPQPCQSASSIEECRRCALPHPLTDPNPEALRPDGQRKDGKGEVGRVMGFTKQHILHHPTRKGFKARSAAIAMCSAGCDVCRSIEQGGARVNKQRMCTSASALLRGLNAAVLCHSWSREDRMLLQSTE